MAGDWIKIRISLFDDPRVFAIAEAVGRDRDSVLGLLVRFWGWADSQTVDGVLPFCRLSVVDVLLGCPGLSSALQSVGWLSLDGDFAEIPNFEEHNGKSAKRRAVQAARIADLRKAVTLPGRQKGDKKATECAPEKRREEYKTSSIEEVCSERTGTPLRAAHIWGKPPIQFDSQAAQWLGISEPIRDLWASSFPAVDIAAELKRAAAWQAANPKNRKSNYQKFLTAWLSRAQDAARPAGPGRGPISPPAPPAESLRDRARRLGVDRLGLEGGGS